MGYIASAIGIETKVLDKTTGETNITHQIVEEIPAPPIIGLVLEGGGVRGIAYSGVVKILSVSGVLEEVKHVAGSSIGAISSLLIALGFSSDEIEDLLKTLPLNEFLEGEKPWPITPSLIIKGKQYYNIINNEGHSLSSGKKLMEWLEKCVERKMGNKSATFVDLAKRAEHSSQYKLLYVTGSNFTKNRIEVFSHFDTPNMPIALAVRISAAYPSVFKGIEYDTGQGMNLYVDGGVMNNLPSFIFNNRRFIKDIPGFENNYDFNDAGGNPVILNIKIDTFEEMEQVLWNKVTDKKIKGIKEYSKALMYGMQSRDREIYEQFSTNTIQVFDYGIGTLQFEITEDEKQKLVESGCEATWDWLVTHVSEAWSIKTYANEKAWLDAKSEKEIADIIKIYQEMLDKEENIGKINKIIIKIEWLKKYLAYRFDLLLNPAATFTFKDANHIDIKPKKPRVKLDEKIKENMKNMLLLIEKQIALFTEKIAENKAKIECSSMHLLHDTGYYEQIVYLAGFEEKNKEFKKEKQAILSKLKLPSSDENVNSSSLCSNDIVMLQTHLISYKNKKTLFKAPHLGFATMLDEHCTKREMSFHSSEGLKIKLDLVMREDFKIYILACMFYLNFIKCEDNFINCIEEVYIQMFGLASIPKSLDDLGKLLELQDASLLIAAYRIEALIKTFFALDKPKLQIDSKLINLDHIFFALSGASLALIHNKNKKSVENIETGVELSYLYSSIVPHHDKFSIFERISFANDSLRTFKNKMNKSDLEKDLDHFPKAVKQFFA